MCQSMRLQFKLHITLELDIIEDEIYIKITGIR